MEQRELEKRRAANKRKRQQQLRRRIQLAGGSVLLFMLVLTGFLIFGGTKKDTPSQQPTDSQPKATVTATPTPEPDNTLELLAAGDCLIHDRVYKNYETADGRYDFSGVFDPVKSQIQSADLAVINQETVLTTDMDAVSSYPSFATPCQIGDAITDAGFDVVLQASNHTMDKEAAGVTETLDYWQENHPEITVLGIHRNQQEADEITVVEKNGICLALLNYTFGFNNRDSSTVPAYLADVYSRDRVQEDVEKAQSQADAVVVFYHVGNEYADAPTDTIQAEFQYLADLGVDVTIACHPHVIQDQEILTGENGSSTLTYYSLGNFLAGQKEPATLLGAMARVVFEKDNTTGEVSIQESQMIPTVSHYDADFDNLTVYPLSSYTEELASQHGIHEQQEAAGTDFNLQYLKNRWTDITGETL